MSKFIYMQASEFGFIVDAGKSIDSRSYGIMLTSRFFSAFIQFSTKDF